MTDGLQNDIVCYWPTNSMTLLRENHHYRVFLPLFIATPRVDCLSVSAANDGMLQGHPTWEYRPQSTRNHRSQNQSL